MAGPTTQKDVAKYLKVHPSTVCLALKNDPRVPAATVERVKAAVTKLGYVRDPMLAAFSAYRNSLRKPGFHGTLAWLATTAQEFEWRSYKVFLDYFEACRQRAQELGYQLVVFDMADYAKRPARLTGVFRARNIRGVIVCPQPRVDTVLDLDFTYLSGVALGNTLKSPQLHSVNQDHYFSVREICARLRERGYRRIGFIVPEEHDRRVHGTFLSAYLHCQQGWPETDRLPPYRGSFEAAKIAPFRRWMKAHRPDALIGGDYQASVVTDTLRLKIPGEIGLVLLGPMEGDESFTGMVEDPRNIGRVAAEVLVSMLEHSQRGTPNDLQRILIRGRWREGSSIRAPLP
ncbi:MAG: LacI family transcriptional regulator [Verrucomicrobia bacterium]|nr:LacI family transcriptional regulator [Verrucomicrobiota bacterium]